MVQLARIAIAVVALLGAVRAPEALGGDTRPVRTGSPVAGVQGEVTHDLVTGQTVVTPLSGVAGIGALGAQSLFTAPGLGTREPASRGRASSENPGSGVGAQRVFPPDTREQIFDTAIFPWRTICKLYILFPDDSLFEGSGTIIGRKYVLTTGHNVYDAAHGGWAAEIEVIPGFDEGFEPYGFANAVRARAFAGWTRNHHPDDDMALITLNRTVGLQTGWLGFANFPNINGMVGNMAAYPLDLTDGEGMWFDAGPVVRSTKKQAFYRIDATGGTSGAGVYRYFRGARTVFAVNAREHSDANSGPRIDAQKYNSLVAWIRSNQ